MAAAAKSKTVTLVANTAQTVTITGKYRRIHVTNFSATDHVSCAFMGVTAVKDGDDTTPVGPNSTVNVYDDTGPNAVSVTFEDADFDVSLISNGTPQVCVWAE